MAKRPVKSKTDAFSAPKERLRRLRAALAKLGHDALLITNPNDIRYLTTFSGEDSFALVTKKKLYVLSDFRFNEQLDGIGPIAKVVLRSGLMHETVRSLVRDLSLDSLAIQAEHVSVAQKATYRKKLRPTKLIDTTGIMQGLRVVKDAEEIASIRKAVSIQQRALKAVLEELGPGVTETEIVARLEYTMKAMGSEGPAFSTMAAVGTNAAVPHAIAGKKKTAKNRPLLIDFGATVDGYKSDMTRVVSFDGWTATMREIYGIVREAHKASAKALKPGISASDVDAVARDLIDEAGYGDAFGHGLGHGIGLDIHEAPRLARTSSDVLEEGMVVTVEPGIYLQGTGGVRIEDDYVITSKGAKNLCTLPKSLEWATR